MNNIEVFRLSPCGLIKHKYKFTLENSFTLTYTSYWIYHRDKDGLFCDEDPKFINRLTLKEWCKVNRYDYDCFMEQYVELGYNYEWDDYCESVNPVCQKTSYGKSLLSGIFSSINNMPECPTDVAMEALEIAPKKLKVKYEKS